MKLPHTEVKFYPEVKSQTGLSSLRVSCKRALTFSTPSPLNFTANNPHIKKYDQTALDYLKRQILTEVTQEIKDCNVSKCNTSSTPDIISSLKSHIQTLENEINFLRSELQEKIALVKSLVTSHMLH